MVGAGAGQFEFLGRAHVAVMVVIAAVPLVLILLARRARRPRLTRWLCWSLAAVLVANEVGYWVAGLATAPPGQFLREFLPLHVCGVGVFLTAWVLVRPRQLPYEVAYYWGLVGTVQAILTPDLRRAFPSYWFFEYFISHGGIVAGVLAATLVMRLRPRPGSVLRVFWLTNAYMLLVAGLNWLLGANYMFLCRPPAAPTPLFFLDWPWYILFLEPVGLALCAAAYLPWFIRDRLGRDSSRDIRRG